MDSLVKSISGLKGRSQEIINEHRNKLDAMPDYSMFNEESGRQMKEEFEGKVRKETLSKLDKIIFDSELNESSLKREINKIKFPFESQAITGSERIEAQITKQRAEQLATQKLNYQILDFLDNEISKNEIDFLFHFKNALPLNTSLESDLQAEINSKLSELEKQIGLNTKKIELQMCEVLKKEAETFKKITEDNDPSLKIQTGYYSGELESLSKQLEEDSNKALTS